MISYALQAEGRWFEPISSHGEIQIVTKVIYLDFLLLLHIILN